MRFSDIVGQADAISRISRMLSGDRRPHALLFAGPAGVGRQTTAMALAAAMLCPEKTDDQLDACGQCTSCRMLASGTHPDLNLVYKELAAYHEDSQIRNRVMQEMGIEVIRRFLIAPAQQASAHGRGKVFIVREAELMSNAAQNSLLKTLEEPPAGVTILLLTQRPEMLLPTTRSRCWMVRFGYLPRDFVLEKLREAQVEGEQARFWAGLTHGSIGRALDMSRRGLYEVKRDVIEKLSALTPGGDGGLGEQLAGIVDNLAERLVSDAKGSEGPDMSKNLAIRRAAGEVMEILAAFFRDALHLRCQAQSGNAVTFEPVHEDQGEAIRRVAEKFDAETLSDIIEQISRFERLLWRNVNAKIAWDNVVVTCASGRPLRLG
jgi:DNA polymerase-3 subunit delta'